MARYAFDCIIRLNACCEELEIDLGPDTAELDVRIGNDFAFRMSYPHEEEVRSPYVAFFVMYVIWG